MANKFEVTDPRGRTVVCTEDRWTNHVLIAHREMRGKEDLVAAAIEQPDFGLIYRDVDYEERDIYYRREAGSWQYTKAVVEFDENERGELVTAYLAPTPKSGEKIIWPD